MMKDARARDWWLAPVEVVEGVNDELVGKFGGVNYTVTVDPGLYWPHADTSSDYPGLYTAVSAAILATSGGTVTFHSATPTASTAQEYGGLRIESDISIVISPTTSTFDVRTLGLVVDGASLTTTLVGSTHVATAPYSRRSTWRSSNIVDGVASRKRAYFERPVSASHDRPADRFALAYDEEHYREWLYEYVQAAHVFEDDAAELVSYAERAGLAQYDTHNAFETIFRAMMQNEIILVAHDDDTWALDNITGVEAVSAYRLDGSISSVLRERSTAGEAYDLALATYIVEAV